MGVGAAAGERDHPRTLVDGRGSIGAPRVSVEDEAAKYFGVGVGGTLTFDVQGVPIEAEVTNLRKIDWQSLSANFFMVLSPGSLDGAPTVYLATARVPADVETRLQDSVVAAFPNVTAIPLRSVLERVSEVLAQISFAVRFMALFSIAAGLVVMAGPSRRRATSGSTSR